MVNKIKILSAFLLPAVFFLTNYCVADGTGSIDRFALVNRHNPCIEKADPLAPFSVGNGEFAFTADVTGLQTFPGFYQDGIPLGTLSSWGWHTIPSKTPYKLDETFAYYDTYGRKVPYAARTNLPAGRWLRANPHRLHLGRIGFQLQHADTTELLIDELKEVQQTLDLWKGELRSSFTIDGHPVKVVTVCHPNRDLIAVRVETGEHCLENLPVCFSFPYGSENWGPGMADWNSPDRHTTTILKQEMGLVVLKRTLDEDVYYVRIQYSGHCDWIQKEAHSFLLQPGKGSFFEFTCEFSKEEITKSLIDVAGVRADCAAFWKRFWMSGGAVDFSQCSDPRAVELERRVILSQYLTAIQCASSIPPQESGLTHNSWYGKFHLEMHWWHAVHFALWNRTPMLEKSLSWYQQILPQAKKMAALQGYNGARWPKMVGPDGREGPSGIGVFLIWQQPHPIYYAELCYRANPSEELLKRYQEIVFETAQFMASYAYFDPEKERYVLGPPLIPAQECYPPDKTYNPTYELAYWAWGLQYAQEWRTRLGLEPEPKWQDIIDRLAPLPQNKDVYVTTESTLDTFENPALRRDHPSLVAALGVLPESELVDPQIMRRTLHKIFEDWNWPSTWGWDYPMMAMTAARVGEPELAIQSLLMDTPKNQYLPNGHCYQRKNLPTYLPANGGLLTAVSMMAAGWDNGPKIDAPGFPKDGKWNVRWENLMKMP